MKKGTIFIVLFVLLGVLAFAFRFIDLDYRPMHHDEANQAYKCGQLLETGDYKYDSNEHHGPTLYYLTLPGMWLQAGRDYTATSESIYRIVPVLFGVGLVLLSLLIADAIGRPAAVMTALITAISPVFVYYSRFYIQEMLLIFFTFGAIGAGWRYSQKQSVLWAVVAGLCLGLMYATKETSVIAFVSMGLALGLTLYVAYKYKIPDVNGRNIMIGVGVSILVAVILFTSFFTNMSGPWDSILAFKVYLKRGAGSTEHIHPCYYYLKMLAWHKEGGLLWSEGAVLILAFVGYMAVAFRKGVDGMNRGFLHFIALYSLAVTIVYSAISYKTPWCLLTLYHGMIVMAGIGVVALWNLLSKMPVRIVLCLLVAVGMYNLGWQADMASRRFCADERNPYVYSHTTRNYLNLIGRIADISAVHPDGKGMLVAVVTDPVNGWPLPWYLRKYSRVGYWSEVDAVKSFRKAPLVITSHDRGEGVEDLLKGDYISEYYGLRPDVLLQVYIRKEYWDEFMKGRSQAE